MLACPLWRDTRVTRRRGTVARDMGHLGTENLGMATLDTGYPLLVALPPQVLPLAIWLRDEEATTTRRRTNSAIVHDLSPAPVCYDLRP